MNTRRFPRTLTEAFPNSTQYACSVERPARRPYPRVLWVVMAAGLIAALLAART
jgi:hypothetical protein